MRIDRASRVLCVFAALLAVVQMARQTAFALNPDRTSPAVYPFDQFFANHSCLSAYFQAAKFAQAGVPHLYDQTLYTGRLGRFNIDGYLYPPQFLLLPRLLLGVTSEFYRFRTVWFAFEFLVLLAAVVIVSRWIGGDSALACSGLFMASVPIGLTLQIGNFQIAAFAISMLAMMFIESDGVVIRTDDAVRCVRSLCVM